MSLSIVYFCFDVLIPVWNIYVQFKMFIGNKDDGNGASNQKIEQEKDIYWQIRVD